MAQMRLELRVDRYVVIFEGSSRFTNKTTTNRKITFLSIESEI